MTLFFSKLGQSVGGGAICQKLPAYALSDVIKRSLVVLEKSSKPRLIAACAGFNIFDGIMGLHT